MTLGGSTPAPTNTPRNETLRRVVAYLVTIVIVVVLWEGAKAIFTLPDYKLPHIATIFQTLTRPTPKGMTLWVLLGDMLYTGMEALLGFALGSIAGFLLAALFVHVKPAERGLMPYVI